MDLNHNKLEMNLVYKDKRSHYILNYAASDGIRLSEGHSQKALNNKVNSKVF